MLMKSRHIQSGFVVYQSPTLAWSSSSFYCEASCSRSAGRREQKRMAIGVALQTKGDHPELKLENWQLYSISAIKRAKNEHCSEHNRMKVVNWQTDFENNVTIPTLKQSNQASCCSGPCWSTSLPRRFLSALSNHSSKTRLAKWRW